MCLSCEFTGGRDGSIQFYNQDGGITGETPRLYFIGVEIEKEYDGRESNVYDMVQDVEGISNEFFSNSEDGSLDDGIEFQSMPATFSYHQKLVENGYYKRFFDALNKWELNSHGTCGSHVHVSRNAITRETLRKMVELMYVKFSDRFIIYIARRNDNGRWAKRTNVYSDRPFTSDELDAIASGDNRDKYLALNNYNRQTCEFRIWDSPDTVEELMQQIEFVVALKRYARATELAEVSQSGFITYVRRRGVKYPNLKSHLAGYREAIPATTFI